MRITHGSRTLIVLLTLLLLPAAGFAQDEKDPPLKRKKTPPAEELVFPEIEGWTRTDKYLYPTADLGYSYSYESPAGGRITVYVYNMGLKQIDDGIVDVNVGEQLKNAEAEIGRAAEMGYYDNVQKIRSGTITLGGKKGKTTALYTLYTLDIRDMKMTSEIYVFGSNNNFIKFRATRPYAEDDAENRTVANFFNEMDALFSK